jgi:ClpP class serine protease
MTGQSLIALHGKYWMVEPGFAKGVCEVLADIEPKEYFALNSSALEEKEKAEKALATRMQTNQQQTGSRFTDMVDANGILRLTMVGAITERSSSWSSGGVALSSFRPIVQGLLEETKNGNCAAKALSMVIDSPGGVAIGSLNAGADIAALAETMPVLTYARNLLASAAVAISCGSHKVIASPAIIAGGVACVMRWNEYRKAEMQRGIDYHTVASGPKKIEQEIYAEDGSLSKESLEAIQQEIDAIGKTFVNLVATQRKLDDKKKNAVAEGGYWINSEVLKSGLIDAQMSELDYNNYLKRYVSKYYKGK